MLRKAYRQFWKDIGTTDPYFGVLTHEQYRAEKLDEAALNEFFDSGQLHVNRTMQVFAKTWPDHHQPIKRALDFGCGAGRLSLALSAHAQSVTGVDISPGMLEQAERHRLRLGKKNVDFRLIEGNTGFLQGTYDYIHSTMVFQHIAPQEGMEILDYLLSKLEEGGRIFLLLTYWNKSSKRSRWISFLNFSLPRLRKFFKPGKDYAFPMFDYDLNEVFAALQSHNIRHTKTTFGHTGNHWYIRLYALKHARK